jgi:hypothetical protein
MTYGNDAVGDLFIDIDEWRDSPRPHRYVHGGFEGTHTLFSCYFPPAEQYRGRFLQYLKGGSGGHETLLPFLAWTFPVAFDGLGTHSRGLTSPSAKRSPRCTGPASPSSPDRALSSLPSGVPRAPAGSSGSRSTEAH